MNITQIDGSIILPAASITTSVELQKEFDYLAAESVTGKLLEAGLITAGEYDTIMQRNMESLSPFSKRVITENVVFQAVQSD